MTDDVYYITESNVHVYGRFVVTNYSMLFAYFDDLNVSKHRKSHDFFYVRLFVFCVFLQQNHSLELLTGTLRTVQKHFHD